MLAIVSLRNRTAGRRGLQNARVWQTWQGYYLRVLSLSLLNILCFPVFYKKISLNESEVWRKDISKQNYCHACHTRFAIFLPLPSCCVSSLLSRARPAVSMSSDAKIFNWNDFLSVCMWICGRKFVAVQFHRRRRRELQYFFENWAGSTESLGIKTKEPSFEFTVWRVSRQQ